MQGQQPCKDAPNSTHMCDRGTHRAREGSMSLPDSVGPQRHASLLTFDFHPFIAGVHDSMILRALT